jgi:hypothetical protein
LGKSIAGIKDDQQLADCEALMEKLSSHKAGKSCLYLKRLDDAHFAQAEKTDQDRLQIAVAETVS